MRKNCQGMTLIEVLVAFIVLSVTMAVIMQIFSSGMRNARMAESYSRAVFLVQSRLAAVGIEQPLVPGEYSGQLDNTLRWHVSVFTAEDGGAVAQQQMPARLYQVRVRADWSEDGRQRQVELVSLRLGPGQ
jgi:general secretion pathway protein I